MRDLWRAGALLLLLSVVGCGTGSPVGKWSVTSVWPHGAGGSLPLERLELRTDQTAIATYAEAGDSVTEKGKYSIDRGDLRVEFERYRWPDRLDLLVYNLGLNMRLQYDTFEGPVTMELFRAR